MFDSVKDPFGSGGGGLDDAVKKIAELAGATDKLSKKLSDATKAAKAEADAAFKHERLKEAAQKMEQMGIQTTKEKIEFLRRELDAQREARKKENKLTREQAESFEQLNVAIGKMKASSQAESIGKSAEKVGSALKKISDIISAAGSEAGVAVTLPMMALKAAGTVISTVGSIAGKGLQNVGGALKSFGSAIIGLGPVGAILGGIAYGIGAVVGYAGEKMQMIAEATGKVINAVADGMGSVLMQMVELAIKLRNLKWQVHDALREADINFGGLGFHGENSDAYKLERIVAAQLGLSSLDRAKLVKDISAASFGQSIVDSQAFVSMEMMKRIFGMGDYGFFGFISRMSENSVKEVTGNIVNIFQILRKVGQETGISLKDWSKAFTETVNQGKRYLISEKETAAVLMKFMQMQKELSRLGIDSASDMSKVIQNFQDFSRKLTEGEQAYFGMQAFGASDPFSGMLKWRYGAGATAFYGPGNEIGIAGAGETGDALEARLKTLIAMANSLGSTGNAEQDLYIRQKFFQSKGMDEQGATILAMKMDNIFSKENQKLLDETKMSAATQKEVLLNLKNSQEKHAQIQEALLKFQISLMQSMLTVGMISALYAMYALDQLRGGKNKARIEEVLEKFDKEGGLIGLAKDTFSQQMKIIKGIGLQGLLSPLHKKILEVLGTSVGVETSSSSGYPTGSSGPAPGNDTIPPYFYMGGFGGGTIPSAAYLKSLREREAKYSTMGHDRHTGGYIKKYHDGGIIGAYKALVKDNEAMFLGNIGASVVPEQNINIMTNDKLSSLIEGVKSNILSSAVGQVVTSKQSNQTDVNINISGNVFALNDFKKIIRDTVLEVIGGR
jgi:hypothetical protein